MAKYTEHTTFSPVYDKSKKKLVGYEQVVEQDFTQHNKTNFGSLLTIVFALILLVVVFRALTGGSGTLTFTGFLQRLSSFSAPFPDLAILDHTIRDGWGLFDGLRNFINIFIQLFDFVLFLAKSMTNVAAYVFDLVKFFFGF